MKAKNGTNYANNFARAAAFYMTTSAPVVEGDARKTEVHHFILKIYQQIAEQGDKLGLKTVPDVSFRPWEHQKGREADVKVIRSANEKIGEIMEQLFSFCQQAELTEGGLEVPSERFSLKKVFPAVLAAVGVTIEKGTMLQMRLSKECAEGLKQLAKTAVSAATKTDGSIDQNEANVLFSRIVFEPDTDWLRQGFDTMMDAEGRVIALCERLEKQGYRRVIMMDGRYLSLSYIKDTGKKPEPVKKAWGDKHHLGIELSYEDLCIAPATLQFRLPHCAEYLQKSEEWTDAPKQLIGTYLKNCDGCRYCVQTDKTGTRPLAAVTVQGKKKCPYYPSFSLRWTSLSEELKDQIEETLLSYH